MKVGLQIVFILSMFPISFYGQTSDLNYSVGFKVGFESFEGTYVEGVDVNLIKGRFIYSLAYNYNREIPILNPIPRESHQQANFLFGSFKSKKSFRFEYQAGLGAIWGVNRTRFKSSGFLVDNYDSEKFMTIGLPIKVGVKYIHFKFMSIGLDYLLNINFVNYFSRPMLTLNFGKMNLPI